MALTNTPRRGRPPSGGRQQILAATFDLLQEKGIARLTTKEIAERAGVSEGSIFYHYKDRSGLLLAVFENALHPLAEFRTRGASATDLHTTLTAFTTAVEQFLEQALVVLFAAQADDALRSALTAYMGDNDLGPHHGLRYISRQLHAMQEQELVRADLDIDAASFMLLSSCMLRVSHPRLIGHARSVPTRGQVVDAFVTMVKACPV